MININVTQIENGWLVSMPPTESEIRAAQVSQRAAQGTIRYCEDYAAVCNALKASWPTNVE